jgi:hypothetical protein
VYELAVEKILPAIASMAADIKAAEELNKLVEFFGSEERFTMIARQLSVWGEKNLDPEVMANLAASSDGVIALYKMMAEKEEVIGMAEPGTTVGNPESELKKLMMKPAYWRDREPKVVAQVEEGFRRLYPEK